MQLYCTSLTNYSRLPTREVNIGGLLLGNFNPIRLQTMTTTDTMDTLATVEQSIRCIEAGAELVRITAPSKKEAENLLNIKNELHKRGYKTPLVADIHFTPNAAEIAARIVEKVRVNPGNYVDKKKFELLEYTDAEYIEEIERIRTRFTPLVKICQQYGTAMRIGTNHGSLSDRIMSRYGDTPMGMVESAMEFLRIARDESYHNIVLSMKSSNPQVMVQAYRLLIQQMDMEFGECYPLHLGVTEAGDGEDGRVKSAAGIGTLLEDGIGDTVRVSLTEDPEFEIPVCKHLVKRYAYATVKPTAEALSTESESIFVPENIISTDPYSPIWENHPVTEVEKIPYDPFSYKRRTTNAVGNIGGTHVPVVVADFSKAGEITPQHLQSIGYTYNEQTDKWNIGDAAADYIFTSNQLLNFPLPGTLKVICYPTAWQQAADKEKYLPIYDTKEFMEAYGGGQLADRLNFVMVDAKIAGNGLFEELMALLDKPDVAAKMVLCFYSEEKNAMQNIRKLFIETMNHGNQSPVIIICDSDWQTADEHLIHYSTECGALLLDGFGDGVSLGVNRETAILDGGESADVNRESSIVNEKIAVASEQQQTESWKLETISGRNYLSNKSTEQFLNNTAFSILQATRTRISKTEYISCPSCGRTLFELQETTAKIRARTNHLKGVKIAIMGCIVNGPGEMADADFGYVGSGVGKITLYRGKDVVKRNVDSNIAVDELIGLMKDSGAWVEVE